VNTISKFENNKYHTQKPKHISQKGMIFSLDAGISFTIILAGLLVFVFTLNGYADSAEKINSNFELEEKALLIADAFVKNNNPENPLLGACIYDAEKKRVKTNELISAEIRKAKSTQFGKIFVKGISYEAGGRKENIQLNQKNALDCISAKRFVLIDGEKGVIFIQTCREG